MNDRQKLFCEYYAKDPNATQAAISAGYSVKTAYSMGSRLLNKVEILKYLNELQSVGERGRIAEAAEVKSMFSDILRDKSEKTSNRIRAGNTLLKSSGAFYPAQAVEENESNDETGVKIFLPYNGAPQAITAYVNEAGEVVPFEGYEDHDLFIYLTKDEQDFLYGHFIEKSNVTQGEDPDPAELA